MEEVVWEFWFAGRTTYGNHVERYLGRNGGGNVVELIQQIRDLEFNCFWSDGVYMVYSRELVHQWHSFWGARRSLFTGYTYHPVRPYRAWHRLR